jgi:hypothetical protein
MAGPLIDPAAVSLTFSLRLSIIALQICSTVFRLERGDTGDPAAADVGRLRMVWEF